ncbi:MAG TPA: hypothetical protein DCR48_09515, partial [Flavobacteriales bacterium]|nr:hypothetical protein [Flavobacteriales bacterium]
TGLKNKTYPNEMIADGQAVLLLLVKNALKSFFSAKLHDHDGQPSIMMKVVDVKLTLQRNDTFNFLPLN